MSKDVESDRGVDWTVSLNHESIWSRRSPTYSNDGQFCQPSVKRVDKSSRGEIRLQIRGLMCGR